MPAPHIPPTDVRRMTPRMIAGFFGFDRYELDPAEQRTARPIRYGDGRPQPRMIGLVGAVDRGEVIDG